MKIRILKNVLVEVEKPKLEELWDRQLKKWEELQVESVNYHGKTATFVTYEGDAFLNVPADAIEIVKENDAPSEI